MASLHISWVQYNTLVERLALNVHESGYEFNQITARLYELFWTHYCDWYLESSKAALYGSDERAKAVTLCIMDHMLNAMLRLLHPFIRSSGVLENVELVVVAR